MLHYSKVLILILRLNNKFEDITRFFDNLCQISAHDAVLILKFLLCMLRILHLLRCSPCNSLHTIADIDHILKANICNIANVDLSVFQWTQVSLPIRSGDLGIRRGVSLALPAFLFSVSSTASLYKILFYFIQLDHVTIASRSTLLY